MLSTDTVWAELQIIQTISSTTMNNSSEYQGFFIALPLSCRIICGHIWFTHGHIIYGHICTYGPHQIDHIGYAPDMVHTWSTLVHMWSCMIMYGHTWITCGHTWSYMNICQSMAIDGHTLPSLPIYVHIWTYMSIYDHKCPCMAIYDHIWTFMSIYSNMVIYCYI